MDITSAITTALALGAAAGLKKTTASVVNDSYDALKKLINETFPSVMPGIKQLEQAPHSKLCHAVVKEDLSNVGASLHKDLLTEAEALLTLIEQQAPQVADIVGVSLDDIRNAAMRVADVCSE